MLARNVGSASSLLRTLIVRWPPMRARAAHMSWIEKHMRVAALKVEAPQQAAEFRPTQVRAAFSCVWGARTRVW